MYAQGASEQAMMAAINEERADRGLGPLKWDPALAQAAGVHARWMSQQPALSHQYAGEPDLVVRAGQQGAHFRLIAENVAMGPSAIGLVTQWMHSAPHRANILNPQVNAVGIALVERGGYIFGVADFADGVASLGPSEIEGKIVRLLEQRGLHPVSATRDARQTCEMEHGSAGGSSPRYVVRWEGTDLTRLPQPLEQQLQTGRFHSGAVGTCGSAHPAQGFTSYRVAVLLY
jgi:hypothetical protein